jgi:hypothetical protein
LAESFAPMVLSAAEQNYVQSLVESSSPAELMQLKANAEVALAHLNFEMDQKILPTKEMKDGEIAIEILVRRLIWQFDEPRPSRRRARCHVPLK